MSGESHGQRSLAGYSPWAHKKSDMAEQTINLKNKINLNFRFKKKIGFHLGDGIYHRREQTAGAETGRQKQPLM